MKSLLHTLVLLLLSFVLAACSGGGGGGGTATYTIGGTVTGLEGTGLVLQNNGGDDIAISTDGSFTFATALANASAYSVTVLTQPTGQTCTVSSASGTVTEADVTDVSVVCVLNYNIGGTISGLTGTVVLQNNSVDDLDITADGVFTFATAIADASSYNITILTQPTGQTCTISNANGTLAGADVTNVTLSCSKVSPLYSANGFDWNDYVQGSDITNATDTTCYADTDTACLHGGEIRMVELTSETSCTGITASDALGAFDWSCDESTGVVRVISSGLASGYGLVNLVDFATPGWKENSLTVYKDAAEIETTTPAVWWSNPVVANTTGGALDAAGTVYVIPSDTIAAYTLEAERVSLVAAPGVVINGPAGGLGSYVISATGMDFLWVEGMTVNAAGDDIGVYWNSVRFSAMRGLIASNADHHGVVLGDSSNNNTLTGVTASNNAWSGVLFEFNSNNTLSGVTASNNTTGVTLDASSNNTLSGVTASNNNTGVVLWDFSNNNTLKDVTASSNYRGIELYDGSYNTLSDITVSNSGRYGLWLSEFSNNTFTGVRASNNDFGGVRLEFSSNNTLTDVTASNNGSGVSLHTSSNNTFTSVTASNNGNGGVVLYYSSNNTLSGVTANNNSWSGVDLGYTSSNNTLSGVTASNNSIGVDLSDSSDNYLTGKLQVGSNSYKDCDVSGGTNPGLMDTSCANDGVSDAALTTGVTIASSFVAKVITDDTVNTSDTVGTATITDFALSFDWANFENPYRAWGVDGNPFPDATNQGALGCSDRTYNNQTDCEANSFIWTGGARIWDWSLLSTDTVIKDVLALPTGDDTLTHTWSDASTSTILRNAVEIMDDGIGNDNTLCETNETCLYTPNMGSYQGHGNLISAGSIGAGGTLENIILMKYETNGY